MSLVLIDCDDQREARMMARFLRSIQNGQATLQSLGENVLFGDTALRLSFPLSDETPERVRVILEARRSPADVTEALHLQTEVDRESAEVFRYFHIKRHSYALTMSVAGVPQMDMLYLAKYLANYPWRARLKQPEVQFKDQADVMKMAGLSGYDQSSPV
jgi:hypothetical protein